MDIRLYNKTIKCPVCTEKLDVTKVRSSAIKVLSRDTDLCVYYEGINPLFYDVFVCEHCGYAAQAEKFETISAADAKIILENIQPKWNKRSFSGDRNIDQAIEAFKLALLNMQVRKAKIIELAKICIRLAWMYRLKKDDVNEKKYLQFALKSYKGAFENERFPIDKLDESTCIYIIAELLRRLEDYEESIKWFSKLVSSPDARRNIKLIDSAREQYQLAKQQLEQKTK
jgi:uncharacterized protein (DUF2225 family)